MNTSEWLQELEKVGYELDEGAKDTILQMAKYLRFFNNSDGELDGFMFLLYEKSRLMRICDSIGYDLYEKFGYSDDRTSDEVSKLLSEDPELRQCFERSEFLIKYSKYLREYDPDDWTPEVKQRFEEALDFLEESLKHEPVQ